MSPSRQRNAMPDSCTSTECSPSRSSRPSLIANTSAKSAATSSSTTVDSRLGLKFRTSICSCQTLPTWRRHHEQVALRNTCQCTTADEGGCLGHILLDGQRLDRESADAQVGPTQHAHVGEVHPVCRVRIEVARTTAEAERLAVDQGDER